MQQFFGTKQVISVFAKILQLFIWNTIYHSFITVHVNDIYSKFIDRSIKQ